MCNVTYHGAWKPNLQLYNKSGQTITEGVKTWFQKNTVGLHVKVKVKLNNTFRCQLWFSERITREPETDCFDQEPPEFSDYCLMDVRVIKAKRNRP